MAYESPTSAEVKAIMSNKTALPNDLDGFVDTAEGLAAGITGLEDSEKKEVVKYLAAHFASFPYPVIRESVAIGGGSVTNYSRGQHGMNLDYTPYGQTAKMLDYTGTLAKLEAKSKEAAAGRTAEMAAYG